jgi:hypothetical protein
MDKLINKLFFRIQLPKQGGKNRVTLLSLEDVLEHISLDAFREAAAKALEAQQKHQTYVVVENENLHEAMQGAANLAKDLGGAAYQPPAYREHERQYLREQDQSFRFKFKSDAEWAENLRTQYEEQHIWYDNGEVRDADDSEHRLLSRLAERYGRTTGFYIRYIPRASAGLTSLMDSHLLSRSVAGNS